MAWIGTLAPADELAVRMGIRLNNPWCHEDKGWQSRIDELSAQCIRSPADRAHYEQRAVEIAHDMEGAVRSMQATAAAPTPPLEPPNTGSR